jgi:hypothetical protein
MKILICGDSWTYGYDVDYPWSSFLPAEVHNVSICGASNNNIEKQFTNNYNNDYDLVCIGWSGATRYPNQRCQKTGVFEFSNINKEAIKFFKNKTLDNLLQDWQKNINTVMSISNVPVIQFSVFGEQPIKKYKNWVDYSFLEYLANKQGHYFEYDLPIFEYDWLCKQNHKFIKKFAKKYFSRSWERACIERENIRPGTYFLGCGHPNQAGHKLWAKLINDFIENIYR